LLIDFVRQRVVILPEGTSLPEDVESATRFLPLTIRQDHLFVPVSLGGSISTGYFWDSGSSAVYLTTTRERWQDLTGRTGVETDNQVATLLSWDQRGVSVAAPMSGELRIGPAAVSGPIINFESTGLPNFQFDRDCSECRGLFGNRLFYGRYTVVLDMQGARFGLLAGARSSEEPPK
jgi:hypothetical protein